MLSAMLIHSRRELLIATWIRLNILMAYIDWFGFFRLSGA